MQRAAERIYASCESCGSAGIKVATNPARSLDPFQLSNSQNVPALPYLALRKGHMHTLTAENQLKRRLMAFSTQLGCPAHPYCESKRHG